MEAARIPPSVRPHFQDRLLRAGVARVKSVSRGGTLWTGTEIFWPRAGVADVGILELPPPARGEVLVKTDVTAVSPGTERALLNLMPGTNARFPMRPGYSGTGTVLRIGSGVAELRVGDRVACTETLHHASLALVRASRVFRLPVAVRSEDAAFLQLIIIALHGLRRARVNQGDRVAIVGAGLVGQIVLQLSRAIEAGAVTMIASTAAKQDLASGADHFIDLSRDGAAVDRVNADVVIEVAGTPEALPVAVRAAAPQGRIALLGSTRGINRRVNFDDFLRHKELSLIGAHISGLEDTPSAEMSSYRDVATEVLALLALRRLDMGSLVSDLVNPLAAPPFYRRLCRGDRAVVGALFDWRQVAERERCRRTLAVGVPGDMLRKGRSYDQNEGSPSIISKPPTWLLDTVDSQPHAPGALRFAIVGCGGMAVRHAAAIRAAANARLVAAMDLDERLARDVAGDGFATTRLEELLARDDVDAVLIVTPNHLHESIGVQAARAGKHVIVEKPIAHNLASADRLIAACRDAGVALSVGYSFRYSPEIRAARRLVERGLIGRLLSVQLTCYFDKPPSYFGSGYTNRTHSDWRASCETAGGGVLVMNMSHQLDQIRYIVGQDLTRVSAVTGVVDSPQGVDVEDVVAAACEFEGGAVGSLFGSCVARGIANQIEIRILGEHGAIVLDPPFRFMTLRGVAGLASGRWYGFGELPKMDVHSAFIVRFADAVLSGRTPEVSGDDGRAIQAWMTAVYESARQGRSVAVDNPLEQACTQALAACSPGRSGQV